MCSRLRLLGRVADCLEWRRAGHRRRGVELMGRHKVLAKEAASASGPRGARALLGADRPPRITEGLCTASRGGSERSSVGSES